MKFGHSSCRILLDDAQSTSTQPTSRLYSNPINYLSANTPDEIEPTLKSIQQHLSSQKYVVANFSYELGEYFQGLTPKKSSTPWIEAWVFDSVEKLSKLEVDEWLKNNQAKQYAVPSGVTGLESNVQAKEFESKIKHIHELIRCGDTYQVNYTYRIKGKAYGDPLLIYGLLREKQPGPFGAYIEKSDGWLLSCSPEWFLRKEGPHLIAKPMKGTGKVGEMSPQFLKNDPKNRAENLMIVDLLRNDLGKISIPGTVKVPNLFDVQQHGEVLQMTSTIEATASNNLTLLNLLKAIFPCGSVTGTPKKRTMEIIQSLEDESRDIYCGSIAWFDPPHNSEILGDLGMNVVIRTLEIDQDKNCCMGIGAGITIDSDATEEWHECQTKADFLYQTTNKIGLFETIRITSQIAENAQLHLDRIKKSAQELGISFNLESANELIIKSCNELNPEQLYRMRLDLKFNGQISIQFSPMEKITSSKPLIWAKDIFGSDAMMHSSNSLLRHKVTLRKIYDLAWQEAEKIGGFDAIFTNELGYVTEGGRSNIFIKKNSQWMTPPVTSGCLPGIMRSILLKDPQWSAIEKNITIEDVLTSDEIILTNALRGVIHLTVDNNS
jgi:para-aminobenzoate synthetase/4-amino-4-deoxychorismate lyase